MDKPEAAGSVLISTEGSERATSDSGKIATFDGKTHLIWQDVTREGYPNRVQSWDHKVAEWSQPATLDLGIDNHARGVMTIDREGFLQVILGGHGSAVSWCRSRRPNDSSAFTEPVEIGVGTYPVLRCAPDGTLLLTLRGKGSERHQRGVDLYRKPPGGDWQAPVRIVKLAEEYGEAYAAFHMDMAAAPDGVLHAIIDFYEGEDDCGRGFHQATCYARSPDGGNRWEKSDGTAVSLPARPEDLDILERHARSRHEKLPPPEIRQGGLVVDSCGRPFMFYLHHAEAPGYGVMVSVDERGQLRKTPVSPHWEGQWSDMRAVSCRASIRDDDAIFALVQLTPYNDEWMDGKPVRSVNNRERDDERYVWLITRDGGDSFEATSFHEPGSACNVPSLERPTGANSIPANRYPSVLYFDGSSGYPGGGDYYASGSSVADILDSGDFRANRVWFAGELGAV